jgi:hypothetical protein
MVKQSLFSNRIELHLLLVTVSFLWVFLAFFNGLAFTENKQEQVLKTDKADPSPTASLISA